MLGILAVLDLIVGVSNDAVNFLNSAIGSGVSSRHVILIVASVGILMGALSSSGMMEVARKGVFYPGAFSLDQIMVVFVAVMITDIVLLDLFNSLALPTSTTVSLVFGLLGAGMAIGLAEGPGQNVPLDQFINVGSALRIISSIFVSVGIAFTLGTIVQFIARFLFTFHIEPKIPAFGALFSGIALTSIFYYVLIEGLHGSQLLRSSTLLWMEHNTAWLLLILFGVFSLISQVLLSVWRYNPLRLVVLAGTFALAMAFAGNDLVNFIGVPLTGLQTYQIWTHSGQPMAGFDLHFLEGQFHAPFGLLFFAGIVMIATLWLSGKAKRVTDTEVSLGRQESGGDEKFKPNWVSRAVVGSSLKLGQWMSASLPDRFQKDLNARFEKPELSNEGEEKAFDLIRASINLVAAAVLIAYGTSLKLPLSTTYVTFMVAMGSSLADRAWGRESAVFRVAGVLNVILGWFVTAIMAMTVAAILAFTMNQFGFFAIVALFGLALFSLIRSHLIFHKEEVEKKQETEALKIKELSLKEIVNTSRLQSLDSIDSVRKAIQISIEELTSGNAGTILRVKADLKKQQDLSRKRQMRAMTQVRKMSKSDVEVSRLYLLLQDLLQDMAQSAFFLTEECATHVLNHHDPPNKAIMRDLRNVERELVQYLGQISQSIKQQDYSKYTVYQSDKRRILDLVNRELDDLLSDSSEKDITKKAAQVASSILLEAKDIAAVALRLYRVYADFDKRPKS